MATTNKIKRNKTLIIILLPIILCIFMVGWLMYFKGEKTHGTAKNN